MVSIRLFLDLVLLNEARNQSEVKAYGGKQYLHGFEVHDRDIERPYVRLETLNDFFLPNEFKPFVSECTLVSHLAPRPERIPGEYRTTGSHASGFVAVAVLGECLSSTMPIHIWAVDLSALKDMYFAVAKATIDPVDALLPSTSE